MWIYLLKLNFVKAHFQPTKKSISNEEQNDNPSQCRNMKQVHNRIFLYKSNYVFFMFLYYKNKNIVSNY